MVVVVVAFIFLALSSSSPPPFWFPRSLDGLVAQWLAEEGDTYPQRVSLRETTDEEFCADATHMNQRTTKT